MRSSIAEDVLRSNTAGGVVTLTLNRPERRNAIDPALRDALAAALDAAATDPAVRGVVITGAGGAFCTGGDLARFEDLHDAPAHRPRALPPPSRSAQRLSAGRRTPSRRRSSRRSTASCPATAPRWRSRATGGSAR